MSDSSATITITLPSKSLERLQQLQQKMEVSSLDEVIKSSFQIFEAVIDEAEAGTEFFIKRAGSEVEPYKIFE